MSRADDPELAEQIAQRVRRHREARAMTQAELAEAVNASIQAISKIERGLVLPRLPMVRKLARALQLSMSELVEDPISESAAAEERVLVSHYRALPPSIRAMVVHLLGALVAWVTEHPG